MAGSGEEISDVGARSFRSHFSKRVQVSLFLVLLWGFGLQVFYGAYSEGCVPGTSISADTGGVLPVFVCWSLLCLFLALGLGPAQRLLDRVGGGGILVGRRLALAMFVGFLGLGILSLAMLVSGLGTAPYWLLEVLMGLALSNQVNSSLILLGSVLGCVSCVSLILDRPGWRMWGAICLLLLALGVASSAWYMIRVEGLSLGIGEASSLARLSFRVMGQMGFWLWTVFWASMLVWRPARGSPGRLAFLAGLGLLLTVSALAMGLVFHVSHEPGLDWGSLDPAWGTPWNLSLERILGPFASAAFYLVLLVLFPILLRGSMLVLRTEEGTSPRDSGLGLGGWLFLAGSLSPIILLASSFFVSYHGLAFYTSTGMGSVIVGSLGSMLVAVAVWESGAVNGRRCALLCVGLALALATWVTGYGHHALWHGGSFPALVGAITMAMCAGILLLLGGVILLGVVGRLWRSRYSENQGPEPPAGALRDPVSVSVTAVAVMPGLVLLVGAAILIVFVGRSSLPLELYDRLLLSISFCIPQTGVLLLGLAVGRQLASLLLPGSSRPGSSRQTRMVT